MVQVGSNDKLEQRDPQRKCLVLNDHFNSKDKPDVNNFVFKTLEDSHGGLIVQSGSARVNCHLQCLWHSMGS